MKEPILIVHGVNNHNFGPFKSQVDKLQGILGPEKQLIPVYWGDLGGQSTDLVDCLPVYSDGDWRVRADDSITPVLSPQAIQEFVSSGNIIDNTRRAEIVSSQVQQTSLVRSLPGVQQQHVRDAVVTELQTTKVLQYINDSETMLVVGRAISDVLQELPASQLQALSLGSEPDTGGSYAVRSDQDLNGETETRNLLSPVKNIVSSVMRGIDEALGRVIGNQLGRLNQSIRARLAVPISATLGDIMSYQRQPDRIQGTLRAAIAQYAPGYGSKEKPISIIAHSLGGVVSFDAAVKPESEEKRLWIKSFVTFGSQAAFFHIVDPRVPELVAYRHDEPVKLPPSIAKWTNLWDPMDLLAFTAGTVFRLADGSIPVDISVQDSVSELVAEKGWAHSVYWESDELANALRKALA